MNQYDKKNRKEQLEIVENKGIYFLYRTVCGRIFLNLLVRPVISKIAGVIMNSPISVPLILKCINRYHIDMSDYENRKYHSYNDFFTRKMKQDRILIDRKETHLISPCYSKLSAYPISEDSYFNIKQSIYRVYDLICDKKLASLYEGGYCLIFRLDISDYHRYCYIDNGIKTKNYSIPGQLHSVQPIACGRYKVYKRNCREYTILKTVHFGQVIQIEVGAMFVGKIKNYHQEWTFLRGKEKGRFEQGGSTIILLFQKDTIILDNDILSNTKKGVETYVKMGQKIGKSIGSNTSS